MKNNGFIDKQVSSNKSRLELNSRKSKVVLPVRLKLLLGIIMVLFSLLILQLGFLQIVKGDFYKSEVSKSDDIVESTQTPRGLIYDSTGKVLVGNNSKRAITFTRSPNSTTLDIYNLSNKLGKHVSVDTKKLNKRYEVEYFLQNPENSKKVLKEMGIDKDKNLSIENKYDKEIKYLVDNDDFSLDDNQKNNAMIFQKMLSAYQFSTVTIKDDDLTDNELSEIGTNLSEYPGIKFGTIWNRNYPQGDEFKSLTGQVTDSSLGIPSDKMNTYLAKGYSQDESVGTSGLEIFYQDTLRGTDKQVTNILNKSNEVTSSKVNYEGKEGDSLNLSLNADFQKRVSDIIKKNMPGRLTEGGYAVAMNPKNGEVYSIAGWDRDNSTGELTSNNLGAIQKSFVMGSVVKPAMIANGFQHGIITPAKNTLVDEKIVIQGTKPKASFFNKQGTPTPLTAQQAIEVSSNVYMMKIAMAMGGFNYSPGSILSLPQTIWGDLRNGFEQFGLGYKTGIDLPGEVSGIKGKNSEIEIGKALDESFGNYDTYTVIQLARYVSAISNGGTLVKPHLVTCISNNDKKDPTKNNLSWKTPVSTQGFVTLTGPEWDIIKQGMWNVSTGHMVGNTGAELHDLNPSVYSKTGIGETFTKGASTATHSTIAFNPDDDLAISLAYMSADGVDFGHNTNAVKEIVEAYREVYQR